MNIQIFGKSKCFDSKKAERWFKERKIKAQYIDVNEKGISRGELKSVAQACGGMMNLIDEGCRDQEALSMVKYISPSQQEDALLDNPQVLRLPIVRNGKKAAVGYQPEVYKQWMMEE